MPDPGVEVVKVTVSGRPTNDLAVRVDGSCVATIPSERHAALLDALLEAEGMEKRWAIAKDPYAADTVARGAYLSYQAGNEEEAKDVARRYPEFHAVLIYVPKEPTDGE